MLGLQTHLVSLSLHKNWFLDSYSTPGALQWRDIGPSGWRTRTEQLSIAMPKFLLPDKVFPPLELTPEQKYLLLGEIDRVLNETLEADELFEAGNRELPETHWKLMKEDERLRVYRQRHPAAQAKSSVTEFNHRIGARKAAHIPWVIGSGSLLGTLDDVSFGALANDDESWRFKSSYMRDKFDDARILNTIYGPTEQEPFRFVGVKWVAREPTMMLSRRDFLFVEAAGRTRDAQGRLVAYFALQSVALPTIRELRDFGFVRGTLSCCFLARQATKTRVDIYCRAFSDPHGSVLAKASALITAKSILSAVNCVEYAHVRKLTWLLRTRQMERLEHTAKRQAPELDETREPACKSCERVVNKFGSFVTGSGCRVCRETVCKKCSVTKTLTVDVTGPEIVRKPLTFCLECVLEARQLSARDVMVSTLVPCHRRLELDRTISVSSSSVSM